jgi:ribonuclease HI
MNFDGSKMRRGLGAGIVLVSPKGDKLHYVLQIHLAALNNVVEYEALVHGLKLAKEIGFQRILCFGDSDLVVHQVLGEWDAKDSNMAPTTSTSSSSVDSSRAASSIMFPEQTMTKQIGYPRSPPRGKPSRPRYHWR